MEGMKGMLKNFFIPFIPFIPVCNPLFCFLPE